MSQIKSQYKTNNSLEKRLKLSRDQFNKKPQHIVLVVEKDPKCTAYPDLIKCTFSIHKQQKVIQIYHAIKKRIIEIDKKYENLSLFIFCSKKIPNKQTLIGQLYELNKDTEDELLYLKYSNMEPFGMDYVLQ